MTGKTHLATGIALGTYLALFKSDLDVAQQSLFILTTGIGSLFPDIDMMRSKMGNKTVTINI